MASVVQVKGYQGTTAEASHGLTFDNPTVTGNVVAVAIASFLSGDAIYTVADSLGVGNIYGSFPGARAAAGAGYTVEIFYTSAGIVGGASHTITVMPNAPAILSFALLEMSGEATSNLSDGGNATGGGSGTTATSGAVLSTTSGMFIGVVTHNQIGAITEDGAWSLAYENENAASAVPISVIYLISGAAASKNATWTVPNSAWYAAVAAFKDAPAAGYLLVKN